MNAKPVILNTLVYGDNLIILHKPISTGSIDHIYLDLPLNSSRNYFVLLEGKEQH